MLRSLSRPAFIYELAHLAPENGTVLVGRDHSSTIRLDSPEVPFLLSRRHAALSLQDGSVVLRDLASTNGTYAARTGHSLRKLSPNETWMLQACDTVGFGGPDSIIAKRADGSPTTVPNPFLFRFYPTTDDGDGAAAPQIVPLATGLQPGADLTTATLRPGSQLQHQPTAALDTDAVMEEVLNQQAPATTSSASPPPGPVAAMLRAAAAAASPRQQQLTSSSHQGKENQGRPSISVAALGECNSPSARVGGCTPSVSDILANHFTCPVCHEWLLASHTLSCGHMFCGLCLATWLDHKTSCPTCRKPMSGVPVRCFQVDATIADVLRHSRASPGGQSERRRKQMQWDDLSPHITRKWADIMNQQRKRAKQAAAPARAAVAAAAAPLGILAPGIASILAVAPQPAGGPPPNPTAA